MFVIARQWYFLGASVAGSLLAIAYFYFQQHLGIFPCSLCMFQRAALVMMVFFCLIGFLFTPEKFGAKLLSLGILFSNIVGAVFAARQVWLQYLPAEKVPECGPDLSFMLQQFPVFDVIEKVLRGSGECAQVSWRFAGVSMAEWMLGVFVVMSLVSFFLLIKKTKPRFSSAYR